jgi:hypothetical protein
MRLLEGLVSAVVVVAALLPRRPGGRLPSGVDAADLVAGYERSDWRLGWVVVGVGGMLAVLGLLLVVVTWLQASETAISPSIARPADLTDRLAAPPTPPPPRLEVDEAGELARYRAAAQQRLRDYGWVDRAAGVVSIPIERAKALVIERGLPQRPGAADAAVRMPSDASSGRVHAVAGP